MLWIILFIISIAIMIKIMIKGCGRSYSCEDLFILSIIGAVAFGITSLFIVPDGLTAPRQLATEKAQILALESEVDRIKNAYYKEDQQLGLANIKQSKELSKYIEKIAILKAHYNSKLTAFQYDRHHFSMWLIYRGAFISSAVDTFKPME